MRKLWLLFLLAPLLSTAQIPGPIGPIVTCEYWPFAKGGDNNIYAWGENVQNSKQYPLPGGRVVNNIGAGFNQIRCTDTKGGLWVTAYYNTGGMAGGWTQILTDTTGAAINNAVNVVGFENAYVFTRADGSLWLGGQDYFNIFTTGSQTMRPIQISPAGVKIGKVFMQGSASSVNCILAISQDSMTVYAWKAGSGNKPTPIQIAGGTGKVLDAQTDGGNQWGYVDYFLVQMTPGSAYGHPFVMGNNSILYGAAAGVSLNYTTPHDIYPDLGLTSPIKEIGINGAFVCIAIDSARNMWEYGGYNVQGQLGIGTEWVNQWNYSSKPYAWDFQMAEMPIYGRKQIGIGVQWNHVYNAGFYVFYDYATDISGNVYAWGSGKQNNLGGPYIMQPNVYDTLRSCCDVLTPKPVSSLTTNVPTCTWVSPSWTIAPITQPVAATSVTLTASGAAPQIVNIAAPFNSFGYTVFSCAWSQVSGPNTALIVSPNSFTTVIQGLVPGTYVFRNIETDNNGGTQQATITIVVTSSCPICPTCPPPVICPVCPVIPPPPVICPPPVVCPVVPAPRTVVKAVQDLLTGIITLTFSDNGIQTITPQ